MAYFPFFMDLSGKKGVVVGGGRIALEKLEKLISFAPALTVIAPEILPEIEILAKKAVCNCEGNKNSSDMKISIQQRYFEDTDIEDAFFVIAATDDGELNARISSICRKNRIPVNVVDDKEKCSFIFPSLVKKGSLTVAISTEGASPQVAASLRRKLETEIPDEIEDILDYLAWLRPIAKEKIPDDRKRAEFLKKTARLCLEEMRVPEESETYQRLGLE